MQIFDELRKLGARHDLSAGLLIGGKNVKEERERVNGERPAAQCLVRVACVPSVPQQTDCTDF